MSFEIISANYNNSKYLNCFFDSIISSSLKPNRIIIVDDCSTDNSLEIINSYLNKINIKLISNSKNIGFANSLNLAINELESSYFVRLDPDDKVDENRFRIQLDFLKSNPQYDCVGSNVTYICNDKFVKNSDVLTDENEISYNISKGILPIIHGSIMGKSIIFNDFRYTQDLVPAEDYDLFAYLIFNKFRLINLRNSLTIVTIHANSVSNDLKFSTIQKRFRIAEKYFNFRKSSLGSYFEYIHQLYYRKFLYENTIIKYLFLIISGSAMPIKTFNKILKKI